MRIIILFLLNLACLNLYANYESMQELFDHNQVEEYSLKGLAGIWKLESEIGDGKPQMQYNSHFLWSANNQIRDLFVAQAPRYINKPYFWKRKFQLPFIYPIKSLRYNKSSTKNKIEFSGLFTFDDTIDGTVLKDLFIRQIIELNENTLTITYYFGEPYKGVTKYTYKKMSIKNINQFEQLEKQRLIKEKPIRDQFHGRFQKLEGFLAIRISSPTFDTAEVKRNITLSRLKDFCNGKLSPYTIDVYREGSFTINEHQMTFTTPKKEGTKSYSSAFLSHDPGKRSAKVFVNSLNRKGSFSSIVSSQHPNIIDIRLVNDNILEFNKDIYVRMEEKGDICEVLSN